MPSLQLTLLSLALRQRFVVGNHNARGVNAFAPALFDLFFTDNQRLKNESAAERVAFREAIAS